MKRLTLGLGITLILAALATSTTTTYLNSSSRTESIVYSNKAMLAQLWETSKANQVEVGSGRTVDRSNHNVTTSEGESYTLLRSVWMDDQKTFDSSIKWTQGNLQRPSDLLYSSRYGRRPDGSYGILTDQGGVNTSAGADTDIALALVMASQRWHDQKYLDYATPIIKSIWNQEVVQVAGKPVLVADNLEKSSPSNVLVNPSYFSPYAYKVFATVDKTHDWNALRDNSYSVLASAQASNLDKSASDGLVPNWLVMNRSTGLMSGANGTNLDSNYGYDAMRTSFHLALDYAWYNDPRDKAVLTSMNYLSDAWNYNSSLASVYSHDAQTVTVGESPAVYGGDIGYFMVVNPSLAKTIYTKKLSSLYDTGGEDWKASFNYYDDNWAWFGLALYNNELPNLTNVN